MSSRIIRFACIFCVLNSGLIRAQTKSDLCLDGFCIGQSIRDTHFDQVEWLTPKKALTKRDCESVSCQPEIAFRGYSTTEQKLLAETLSWNYGMERYNILTNRNLATLRRYAYECNPSPRGYPPGERRFFGGYRSSPSQYLTIVGLRLVGNELRVYRIARQYPFHTANELATLAHRLREQYGENIVLYDGVSSNACYEVIKQKKEGWFGRSNMFDPNDLANNTAELVLIDPRTRQLLQPTNIPESGEIEALPMKISGQCSASVPLQ